MNFRNPIIHTQARIISERGTKAVTVQVKPKGVPWKHASQFWEETKSQAVKRLERGLYVQDMT
jgi:hypothetical protein